MAACQPWISLPSKRMAPWLAWRRSSASPSVVLPEPGFADDADRVPFPHGHVDAVDRADVIDGPAQQALLDREMDLDVARGHDIGRIGRRRRRVALGLRRQQALGVGVLRAGEQGGVRALLDDLAVAHDADMVGHLADDAEVVGDQQQRHAEAALQILQQFQDLGLDRHVEGGGRLVRDQQVRLVGERHRDHDALALTAGQLVRICRQPLFRFRQTHQPQQFQRPLAGCRAGQALVQEQGFVDLLLDAVQRVERGHRLLEDHRDPVAAHLAQGLLVGPHQFGPLEADAAAGVVRHGIGQKLEDRQRGHRLAGAGLADQRHGFARLDVERHAFHGMHRAAGKPEIDGQVADGKKLAHDLFSWCRAVAGWCRHSAAAFFSAATAAGFAAAPVLGRGPTVLRGSKASRTASPMKISRLSMMASVKNAVRPSHGA